MKKIMDKLLNNIRFDKRYVLFSVVLVILGIITGSIFVVILNSTDKSLVIEYITSFVDTIRVNKFNYVDTFRNTIIINYSILLILSVVGFSYFLVPINILILFYKAFIIGFCLSSFVLTYKIKGLLLSILYIFPHLIINILIFSLLVAFTIKLSLSMIKCIIRKKQVNMRMYFNKYFNTLILFMILITISTLYESFIAPFILKFVINILI